MRRGCSDKQWLVDEEEKFIGINLGWDFTSEHEWGVQKLLHSLNIADDEKICGIDRRRVGEVNPDNVFFDKKKGVLIVNDDSRWGIAKLKEEKFNPGHYELALLMDEDLATAWDGHSFGIHVKGKENIKKLEELHEALMNKNVIVFLGGSNRNNPFARSGFNIVIYDRIPAEGAQVMKDADEDYLKLKRASEKTGIQKKLDAHNKKNKPAGKQVYAFAFDSPCGYYALSPKWKFNPGREIKTKHPVIYWLNPMKQDETNYGWFTVEELLQWMKGKGPIPKEKEKVNAN